MRKYTVLLCLLLATVSEQSQSHQDQSSLQGQSLPSADEQLASQGGLGLSQNYGDQSSHRGQSLSSVDQQLASQDFSRESQNQRGQSSQRGQSLSPNNEQLASQGYSGQPQNQRGQSSQRGQSFSLAGGQLGSQGQSQKHHGQLSHRGQSQSMFDEQLASQGYSGQLQKHRGQSSQQGQSWSLVDEKMASQGVSVQSQNHRGQSSPRGQQIASQGVSASTKPCRRQNNFENFDSLSPDASSVQKLQFKVIHPLNQKVSDDTEDNLEGQNFNGNEVPLVLGSSDIEDLLDTKDELCQDLDEDEDYAESQNLLDSNKNVQKQALELVSRCIQRAKYENNQDQGNTRRSNNESNKIKPEENSYSYGQSQSNEGYTGISNNESNNILPEENSYPYEQFQSNKSYTGISNDELYKNKPAEQSYAHEPSKSNGEKRNQKFRFHKLNSNEVQIHHPKNPAQGEGITSLAESRGVLLLHNTRVCYACTTTNDPSCWNPDHSTTVKYCKKEDDACITKTFKAKNEYIVVRDCGSACVDSDFPGVPLKYKSCRICHTDQCNSAGALTGLNMLLVAFIVTAVKFTL